MKMKNGEFKLSEFNPDAMNQDEIQRWIEFIGPGSHPTIARQWFTGQRGMFKHARAVRNYLWNKTTAISCRLEGKIETAQRYESICDRIYTELPVEAKW